MIFAGSLMANRRLGEPLRPEYTPRWACRRIVSMAPSITETLYALGLGDRVVGVSRFCEYPPAAREKPTVGGYYDPNLEALVTLRPDLVIMLKEQAKSMPAIQKLNLETLVVNQQTIEGTIDSFRAIGRRCGRGPEGRALARQFQQRLDWIRAKTAGLQRPRVLFVLDRTFSSSHLADIYVAGADDFFDTIIELAGGQNACRVRSVRNPVVAPEGIMRLDPDVIVDLAQTEVLKKRNPQAIRADWNELAMVKAVRDGRVLIFDKSNAFIPGPRLIQSVEDLARALHPEVDWGEGEEGGAKSE